MKRFKITMMVPHSTEILVESAREAHNEATRMVNAAVHPGEPRAVLASIEEVAVLQDTDSLDFT